MGYYRAGFDVVGVDIEPQPHYPFEFIQGDALQMLQRLCSEPPDRFGLLDGCWSAIHASPPCQAYTVANNIHQREHPDLLPETRQLLQATGLPYIIENVPGAPMHVGPHTLFDGETNGALVCGLALGLNVKRHRWFEANVPITGTICPPGHPGDWLLVFGHTVLERGHEIGRTPKGGPRIRRKHATTARGREAMGIDWMNREELSEAIPPAYTQFIGEQLMAHLRSTV